MQVEALTDSGIMMTGDRAQSQVGAGEQRQGGGDWMPPVTHWKHRRPQLQQQHISCICDAPLHRLHTPRILALLLHVRLVIWYG